MKKNSGGMRPRRPARKPKIVWAPQTNVEALRKYVDQILTVVKDMFDIESARVSDETCLSDFFACLPTRDRSQDQSLYDQIGNKLGIQLDQANQDDHVLVKIALRLKQRDADFN